MRIQVWYNYANNITTPPDWISNKLITSMRVTLYQRLPPPPPGGGGGGGENTRVMVDTFEVYESFPEEVDI